MIDACGEGLGVEVGVGAGVIVGVGTTVGEGVGMYVGVGKLVTVAYMLIDPLLSVPDTTPNGFTKSFA